MDNQYLKDLISEAQARGGGMLLSYEDQPAAVVLSVEKYNELLANQHVSLSAPTSGKAGVGVPTEASGQTQTEIFDTMKHMNKNVLVTGGAGYIGGHLVHELIKAGYKVTILDNLSTGRRENIHPQAKFVEGDLADENLLRDLFAAEKFDAVFHMAASLEVAESVKEPEKYFQNNVVNAARLLNAMNEAGIKKIIFSSTAAVYGQASDEPVTETSPLRPNNPYGSSKLLVERIVKYYCEYLGFKAVVFRYFNACGFDLEANILPTHHSHLIYNVLNVAKGGAPHLQVFGNDYPTFDGTCIRDYVHVTDIVLPHILALEKMDSLNNFEIFNIGTGHGSSVWQVANGASEIINRIIPMEVAPRRDGDAAITVADNSKLVNVLGYTPGHSDLQNMIATSWEVLKND